MPRRPRLPDARSLGLLLTALRAGSSDEVAAVYAGVTEAQWIAWLTSKQGKADYDRAKAELAVFAAGVVRQAAGRNPMIAAKLADRQAADDEIARLKRISRVAEV